MLQLCQAHMVPAGHFACEVWFGVPVPAWCYSAGEERFSRFAPATSREGCGPEAFGGYSHSASRVAAVLIA